MPFPSMSKTDLVMQCSWWAREDLIAPPAVVGDAARYGSAFHLLLAQALSGESLLPEKTAKRFGVRDPKGLYAHALSSHRGLKKWLEGDNEFDLRFVHPSVVYVEKTYALHLEKMRARFAEAPTEDTHQYPDRKPGEMCGTADLVVFPIDRPDTVLVMDHKTGQYEDVEKSGQLKSLALAACLHHKRKKAIVAIHHTPKDELPTVYSAEYPVASLLEHGQRLARKVRGAKSGALRPGDWCKYCPGLAVCPTKTTGLVQLGFKGRLTTPAQVGRIHQALGEYDAAAAMLRDLVRTWVKKNPEVVVERPDGKVLVTNERTRRGLSMASIKRAMGEVKGAMMLEKLEKLGCIEETTYEELRAGRDA